jgi:cardiolipin synthase A/B
MLRRSLLATAISMGTAVAAVAAVGLAASPATAATTYTLQTFPDQGFSSVYSLINGAQSSIDMTMYELSDTTAEDDLAAAAKRGVDVRVILDQAEKSTNAAAFKYLNAHDVDAVYSSTAYTFTHQKTITVDGTTSDILTANLTSKYYSTTRDFGVVDTDANDIAAIVKVFNADFAHKSVAPGDGDDLVWSPTDSQAHLLALINGATTSLSLFEEEMSDSAIINALVSAAKRGVDVQLVGENEDGDYDSEYDTLAAAGVHISYYSSSTGFYIHAKVIEADYGTSAAKVFIGSENATDNSLNDNRELGLIISTPAILSSIEATFSTDFSDGTPWTG